MGALAYSVHRALSSIKTSWCMHTNKMFCLELQDRNSPVANCLSRGEEKNLVSMKTLLHLNSSCLVWVPPFFGLSGHKLPTQRTHCERIHESQLWQEWSVFGLLLLLLDCTYRTALNAKQRVYSQHEPLIDVPRLALRCIQFSLFGRQGVHQDGCSRPHFDQLCRQLRVQTSQIHAM